MTLIVERRPDRLVRRVQSDNHTGAILERVVERTSRVSGVVAIVLGGSRARGTADVHSDIDLGLYYDSRRPFRISDLERAARDLDDRHSPGLVTDFGAWGPGVDGGGWLQVKNRHLDFIYRDLVAVRTAIDECRRGQPQSIYQLGHPLGFHNQIYAGEVNLCVPLHDPREIIKRMKRLIARYPAALRRAVVTKHLFDATFELAIAEKQAQRGDVMYVSGCLFRAAGFMTLVIHALNRKWMINEKGALAASRKFGLVPTGFHSTVERVLANPGSNPHALAASIKQMESLAHKLQSIARKSGIAAATPSLKTRQI